MEAEPLEAAVERVVSRSLYPPLVAAEGQTFVEGSVAELALFVE